MLHAFINFYSATVVYKVYILQKLNLLIHVLAIFLSAFVWEDHNYLL